MRFLGEACALAVAGCLSANALSVSPTRIVIKDDSGANVSLRLVGESEPTPIEVTIIERLPGGALTAVSGSVIRANPPQLLLDASQPRSVQIEISNGIALEKGRSFYLRIEQLGLRSAQRDAVSDREVVLLATYLLPVHVLGGHNEKLFADFIPDSEGALVVLTNAGQGPALLSGCRVTITYQTGRDTEIEGRKLAAQIGSDAILAGETVRFDPVSLLPMGESQPEAVIGVRVDCVPSL